MEINGKLIYFKILRLFSEIFLVSIGMKIGIEIFPKNEKIIKPLIALLGFISFRIFLSFLICFKLFLNIGNIFADELQFKLWKYSQKLFVSYKITNAIEILYAFSTMIYLFTKLSDLSNFSFTIYVLITTIFYALSLINLIIFEPNNFDIMINSDYFKNNQILKPKKEIKRNIPFVDEECSICLQNELGTEWGELPCRHKFHYECINDWMKIGNICPICRQ